MKRTQREESNPDIKKLRSKVYHLDTFRDIGDLEIY